MITFNNKKNQKTFYFFDFDDTLVNNHDVDFQSFNIILKKHGLPLLRRRNLLSLRKKGLLAEDIFKSIAKESNILIKERKNLLSKEAVWKHLKLNRGVKKTLRRIKSRGDDIIIITKKKKDLVKRILVSMKISVFIDGIYTSERKHKIILEFRNKFPKRGMIFVSDSEEDIIPVKRLGLKTYFFYNDYKDIKNLRKISKVITSLDEILD